MNVKALLTNRFAALSAMAAGALWIASGAMQLTKRDDIVGEAVDTLAAHVLLGLLAGALVLTVPAVLTLGRHARGRGPRFSYAASAGMLTVAVAATTANIVGEDPLFFLVAAPLGNLFWLVGTIGLAVALHRAGVVPRSVAIALPSMQVFALPLSFIGGPIVTGAFWIAIGYLLEAGALPARRSSVAAAS